MNMISELQVYEPFNEQEESDRNVMLEYLITFDNVYERSNHFGHMTASPWIMNENHTKVLMIYHNIYKSWGWCGGHCDGDHDLLHVALKEGLEESGLHSLKLISDKMLSLEILPVPPHKKHDKFVSSHVHLNITYLFEASERDELHSKPDENSGVRWMSYEEIDTLVTEEDMKPIYHKLVEKSKLLLYAMNKKDL